MLQDLKVHVDEAWGRENYMLDQLCLAPSRTLALLLLLALALRSKKQISDLLDLVQQLPEELLAIIRPEHVVRWIHDNIPRSKQQTDSFVIFALDEVCTPLTSLLLSCQCCASSAGNMHLIADMSWSSHVCGNSGFC
jgi:predicted membrane chloride channel (bestrophin family)